MNENPPGQEWKSDQFDVQPQQQTAAPTMPKVTWSASEFISHQKTGVWYLGLGVATALITFIIVIVTKSFMSAGVVALTSIVLGFYAARKPEVKQYEINEYGVMIADKAFPYETFKSFSVVQEGAINSIWLRPLKKYLPTITMYFSPEDEDRIVDTLQNFLPEEDRALDSIERFTRRIRF